MGATKHCINKFTNDYNKCQDFLSDILIGASKFKQSQGKQKLEQVCCGYLDTMTCLKDAGVKNKCPENHADDAVEVVRGLFDGAVNVICSEYGADTDKCDKVTRMKFKPAKNRPKSVFFPVMQFVTSL